MSATAPAPAGNPLPLCASIKTHVRAAELFADWTGEGRVLDVSGGRMLMLVARKPA